MPIRFPFRRAGPSETIDESLRDANNKDIGGSRPRDIKEPIEYKLSEIGDGGVFLPPSPPEKPSFWHSKSNTSTTSSNHRSLLSENEPFNISRESFDSYRRSFDISARSPIPESFDGRPRHSLDARQSLDLRRSIDVRRSRAPPRASLQEHRRPTDDELPKEAEEGFEEVGLNDDPKPAPKKKGLFARFGADSSSHAEGAAQEDRPSSSHLHFHFTGRKRAQSGQGSELKSMPRPSASQSTPTEVS